MCVKVVSALFTDETLFLCKRKIPLFGVHESFFMCATRQQNHLSKVWNHMWPYSVHRAIATRIFPHFSFQKFLSTKRKKKKNWNEKRIKWKIHARIESFCVYKAHVRFLFVNDFGFAWRTFNCSLTHCNPIDGPFSVFDLIFFFSFPFF